MLIQLSYWDIEEAVIEYLQKKYRSKFESMQFQGAILDTTETTYAYKKDKDGREVVDRDKTKEKKTRHAFDGDSELEFYIEPLENKDDI